MKVLQTLGRHGGAQEGVFQYKRNADGPGEALTGRSGPASTLCQMRRYCYPK